MKDFIIAADNACDLYFGYYEQNPAIQVPMPFTVDGKDYERAIKEGVAILTLSDLEAAEHTLNVSYNGDGNFISDSCNSVFVTKNIIAQINVTAKNIVYGNDLTVSAVVTSGATGSIMFTVNGVNKSATIKNNAAKAVFTGINAGKYEIMAYYSGDDQYISSYNRTSVEVAKAKSFVLIDVGKIAVGENVVITFTSPSDATGTVTIEIDGKQ